MRVKEFMCRDLVEALFVEFGYVPGIDNLADMLTNAL